MVQFRRVSLRYHTISLRMLWNVWNCLDIDHWSINHLLLNSSLIMVWTFGHELFIDHVTDQSSRQEPWSNSHRFPSARWLFGRARGLFVCRGTLRTAWSQGGHMGRSRLAQQIYGEAESVKRRVFGRFFGRLNYVTFFGRLNYVTFFGRLNYVTLCNHTAEFITSSAVWFLSGNLIQISSQISVRCWCSPALLSSPAQVQGFSAEAVETGCNASKTDGRSLQRGKVRIVEVSWNRGTPL